MKYKNLLIVLISFGFIRVYSQLPVGRDTATVYENGKVLKLPWAGGLNYCMFSHIDLNLDGKQDIVAFDKVNYMAYGKLRCFINYGGVGEIKYSHGADYEDKFPAVQQWALFYDYNNDGKADLFTSESFGIKVYKNTSVPGNLSFQLEKFTLRSNFTPTISANIFVSPVSFPGVSDIDNDGDMDILTFSSSGIEIEYHKNKSMEMYSIADSLVFDLEESTWGNITESNCSVVLNQSITTTPGGPDPNKIYHAGSGLMVFDRDGDGDKDLLMGDISCNRVNYCENGGTPLNANMIDTTKLYPNYPAKASTQIIRFNNFPCAYNIDVDNDGKKDMIASPNAPNSENTSSVWLFKNNASGLVADFQFIKGNFLQDEMMEHGDGSYPAIFDVDNDGLQDLIVGNTGYYTITTNKTKLAYYRNIGTLTQPSFSLITRDFANLSSTSPSNTLTTLIPTFGDIDGDGDKDMLLADYYGKIHWVENTAGAGNPCNFSIFKLNYFGISTTFPAAHPQLIDVDKDGDLDLLIGLRNGRLSYFRNNGTATSPVFALITNAFGNVNVKRNASLYPSEGHCAPFLFDDNGSYKLLCGSTSGYIYLYDNIDGNLGGNFNLADSLVNKINTGPNAAPQYSDIDGDNEKDLIIGNFGGGLAFYSSKKSIIGINEIDGELDSELVIYPNPSKDLIHINFKGQMEKMEITLLDMIGKEILFTSSNLGAVTLNCEAISPGIYLLRSNCFSKSKSRIIYRKLIIQ